MVEVPDQLAPALADLALVGAAARARRDGGGHLHPDLAELLATLASPGSATGQAGNGHAGPGDASQAAKPVVWVTTGEAAQRLHLTASGVRKAAAAGRLTARRSRGGWLIGLHPEDTRDDGDHHPGRADRR